MELSTVTVKAGIDFLDAGEGQTRRNIGTGKEKLKSGFFQLLF